jgi:hypothetical protein
VGDTTTVTFTWSNGQEFPVILDTGQWHRLKDRVMFVALVDNKPMCLIDDLKGNFIPISYVILEKEILSAKVGPRFNN